MVKQNLRIPTDDIEKKYQRKDEKKKKRMKVSGAGVKALSRIIKNKA